MLYDGWKGRICPGVVVRQAKIKICGWFVPSWLGQRPDSGWSASCFVDGLDEGGEGRPSRSRSGCKCKGAGCVLDCGNAAPGVGTGGAGADAAAWWVVVVVVMFFSQSRVFTPGKQSGWCAGCGDDGPWEEEGDDGKRNH